MPNWCNNTVEIAHKDPAKLKELVDALNEGKFCQYAIPVPTDLHIVAGRVGDDNDPKQIELEAQEKRNLETHGYKNWYDFCVNEWGTKWDVGSDRFDPAELEPGATSTTVMFDSAWSPPIGVYEALVEQGFEIRAHYYEPGMAYCGTWDNGYDAIDEELDDMFGGD